jgi:hypothetical protein
MKKILLCLAVVLFMGTPAFADEADQEICTPQSQTADDMGTLLFAQRGCCSGRGGISGCIAGRVVCGDGTLSPTCRCLKSDEKIEMKLANKS